MAKGTPKDGQREPEGTHFQKDFYKKDVISQKQKTAGGKIAPETRTFTKTNVIFQKNDPPEAG